MQIDQQKLLPLDEMRGAVSDAPAEAPGAVQVAAPDERISQGRNNEESVMDAVFVSLWDHRQVALPSWPTSQPGPEVTAPSPGQRVVSTRTDQVMYDFYDQERGRPGLLPPASANHIRESTVEFPETRQRASNSSQASVLPPEPQLLGDQVSVGQQVYDTQGTRVGKVAVRFPLYILIEQGWIFPRVYYVPLSLVAHINGPSLWLNVSEATLKAQDFAQVPQEINDAPARPARENLIDISDVSSLGMSPLTPAETGHYHYGPHSPGINTDAGGSYTQAEMDPRGRLRSRPVKLYITGQRLSPRNS